MKKMFVAFGIAFAIFVSCMFVSANVADTSSNDTVTNVPVEEQLYNYMTVACGMKNVDHIDEYHFVSGDDFYGDKGAYNVYYITKDGNEGMARISAMQIN